MMYRITYATGQCSNYAHSRKDLLEWLKILKDETITKIQKISKEGNTEEVTDRYRKYIKRADKDGGDKP